VSTRQYVGAIATLNNTLEKLPPGFEAGQKVSDTDMMDILASKAPEGPKELMTDHGFDPQTATTTEFVEIYERAETKEAVQTRASKNCYSDNDSSEDETRPKKPKKKAKTSSYNSRSERSKFYCKEHEPNGTHYSSTCKVLLAKKEGWKKKDTSKGKYADYKSKCKKKHQELNLLYKGKPRRRRPNGPRLIKNLKSTEADNVESGKESESSEGEEPMKAKAKLFAPKQPRPDDSKTDSNSSSSSDYNFE
jgi:hypothetical protein